MSGGWPWPQLAKSRPSKLESGAGAGEETIWLFLITFGSCGSGSRGVLERLGGAAAGGSEAGGRALGALLLDDVALQLPDVEDLAVGRLQVELTRVGLLDGLWQMSAHGRCRAFSADDFFAAPCLEGCSEAEAERVTAT